MRDYKFLMGERKKMPEFPSLDGLVNCPAQNEGRFEFDRSPPPQRTEYIYIHEEPQQIKRKAPKLVACPSEADLQHDKVAEEKECCVCQVNLANCIVAPCNQICLCISCARQLTHNGTKKRGEVVCPLCRANVKAINRVFLL